MCCHCCRLHSRVVPFRETENSVQRRATAAPPHLHPRATGKATRAPSRRTPVETTQSMPLAACRLTPVLDCETARSNNLAHFSLLLIGLSQRGFPVPTTIKASFEGLKRNMEITNLQASTTSTRQKNVREAMEVELSVLDSFLTGSYARDTMIAPLKDADIDIFVVLSPEYFTHNGQASLLDTTRRVLRRSYGNTPNISRNGQAVTIVFSDFRVDVVPAFNRQGGGYLIPNATTSAWISTDPRTHVSLMTEHNTRHSGTLVPLIKMLKGWNRNLNYAFESFYLELLAINVFANVTISDYSSGARYFFDKGRDAIRFQISDPAGFGGYINALRAITTLPAAVQAFETAHAYAVRAEDYASRGLIRDAIGDWRTIFGDYFPAFG